MTQRTGYLLIDHRASPGIPADTALQIGLDPACVAEGKLAEFDTLTCVHCKIVVLKNPLRTRERASCPKCRGHYICDYCHAETTMADYSHLPYEKFCDVVLDLDARGILAHQTSQATPQELFALHQVTTPTRKKEDV